MRLTKTIALLKPHERENFKEIYFGEGLLTAILNQIVDSINDHNITAFASNVEDGTLFVSLDNHRFNIWVEILNGAVEIAMNEVVAVRYELIYQADTVELFADIQSKIRQYRHYQN